jgi:hypothetical protein
MDPLREKAYNARINVWMRAPGLTLGATMLYLGIVYDNNQLEHEASKYAAILVALLALVNGQYYMQEVVGNTFRKVETHNS